MEFKRSAGVLLHPTSLPGSHGIGELGKEAFNFIDFLAAAGQTIWQVLPMGPTGYGDSPYQCFSAFAGNPLLINLDELKSDGLLSEEDLNEFPDYDPHKIDFGSVINIKFILLWKAYETYLNNGKSFSDECKTFCKENSHWLDDYALFMACKNHHQGVVWTEWSKDIAFREDGAVDIWTNKLSKEIQFQKFLQYKFFTQWTKIKEYANQHNIKIIGDIPIFIAYDSADLWSNRDQFTVDKNGKLETIAGVPPDYFSPTGQLWGNPLYRWDKMEEDNFSWWKKRLEQMLKLVDYIRIDHFRGMQAFYEIPGGSETAQHGRWMLAPGRKMFQAIKDALGELPILAEDLGIITKEVRNLRDEFGFPGMRIMQFAFGSGGEKKFLPHNYDKNTVVYTGSHDNDTTRSFFEKESELGSDVFLHAQEYLNYYGDDICFQLIKAAQASVANIVIIPMQDMLNLGSDARMNFPGVQNGNWQWRFTWDQVNNKLANQYKEMSELYERSGDKKEEDEIVIKYGEYL
ncbi:MAG: 4-alpha-glucanotransferase [Bacteroidetes bacterium]|nr:4-alpha-glucanotransferase [Bacteroidota bacterium]